MMIKLVGGNLLEAKVEALVNAVNTEGVMGKGIALQFREAYPAMYLAYRKACKSKKVRLGRMHVYENGSSPVGPRWIINFPTKGHWKEKSRMADIESGLKDLVAVLDSLKIRSIAVPALGCGYGGLEWDQVRKLIENALSETLVEVFLYVPEVQTN